MVTSVTTPRVPAASRRQNKNGNSKGPFTQTEILFHLFFKASTHCSQQITKNSLNVEEHLKERILLKETRLLATVVQIRNIVGKNKV